MSTASSTSALSITTTGFFPPISSWTRLPDSLACDPTVSPTAELPVNDTASIASCVETVFPTVRPGPVTMLSAPSGRPASSRHSTSWRATLGAMEAGLNTTVVPAASAGAIFQAGMAMG